MTTARRRFARASGAWFVAAFLAVAPPAAQEWRAQALESFDLIWRTVQDTHFDPSLGGLDWHAVRTELRPGVEKAATMGDARATMREMLARLGQSHYELIAKDEGPEGVTYGPATVPFDFRVADAGVLVIAVDAGSSAEVAGLKAGDRLLSVDRTSVDQITSDPSASPARDLVQWQRVAQLLSGDVGSAAQLVWRRPDRTEQQAPVARIQETGELVQFGNLPALRARIEANEVRLAGGGRAGVIAFNIWMPVVAEPFASAIDRFRGADGLVIDLRGNPGGIAEMIRGVAGHILSEPLLLGRVQMRAQALDFRANPRRSTSDGRAVEPFAGPVAVLVDGLTASASECFAGGLQSLGRVRVFGTRSMGQALPAATRPLPDGDVLMYAVGDFVTSTGRRLEGGGVVPDEIVPLVAADLAAGRDARARALSWLDGQVRRR